MSLQRRSEQACLTRQDLGHTHLAHVLEGVIITNLRSIITMADWTLQGGLLILCVVMQIQCLQLPPLR